MKSSCIIILLCSLAATVQAQQVSKKTEDRQAIKAMCGCYEITFKYAETFRHDTTYKFRDPYITGASAEWIFVDEETDDKMVIQHILVAQDTIVIKHWRQDWLYENTRLFEYIKNNDWEKHTLPSESVKGQWTQKVYHVDDGPRYEGTATWIHEDGKHYWEAYADAPLPRRERTKRSDYNVMNRLNRHQLTETGWIHEQDNKKIIRKNGTDSVLVEEKGYNIYKQINDSQCRAAQNWWNKHKAYWRIVRDVWEQVYAENDHLHFKTEIDEKRRWQHFFELQDEYVSSNRDSLRKKITEHIRLYMDEEETVPKSKPVPESDNETSY